MPEKGKKTKGKAKSLSALQLTCTSFGDHSEIDGMIDGKWETIATTHSVNGFDAEDIAHAIIRGLKCESQK